MSALGDYIHYRASNYTRYGTAHRNETPKRYKSITNLINNRIEDIPSVSNITLAEIQNRLRDDNYLTEQEDRKKYLEKRQQLIDMIYKDLVDITSKNAFRAYGWAGGEGLQKMKYSGNYDKDIISKADTKGKIQKIKNLRDKIEKINNRGMVTEKELQEILNLYSKIGTKKFKDNSDMKSILGKIQEEVDRKDFNTSESLLAGDFGERYAMLADDIIMEKTGEELNEVMKTLKPRGGQSTPFQLDKSKITNAYVTTKDNSIFQMRRTKDKIDISITVNGEEIDASVKNYRISPDTGAHLQDVNLIYALVYLNELEEDFGNHWINLHALNISDANKKDADEAVTKEIAYEALVTGNPLKQNVKQANTFIYLDRSTGKVYAKNTKDILKTMKGINISGGGPANLILENHWNTQGYEGRITNIINQIHATKYKVSYSPF